MATKSKRLPRTGSVFYRESDGKWIAQVSFIDPVTRKQKKVRRTASSRAEARAKLQELLADLKNVKARAGTKHPRGITFDQYASRWLDVTLPLAGLRPNTEKLYRSRATTSLIPALGAVPVAQLSREHIEAFQQKLMNTKGKRGPLSASTQRVDFDVLRKILALAVTDGLLAANPCDVVARPKVQRAEVHSHPGWHVKLIEKEVAAVTTQARNQVQTEKDALAKAKARNAAADAIQKREARIRAAGDRLADAELFAALWLTVSLTGCRIGEALGLEWKDVDLGEGVAKISHSKTDAGMRQVRLLPEVVASLTAWKAQQKRYEKELGEGWPNSRGLVFTTKAGTPLLYRNATRTLLALIDRVNGRPPLKVLIEKARPWHTFRHSLATRLLNSGVPMPVVKDIVGHASIRTTVDIYGHAEDVPSTDVMAAGR